MSTEIEAEAMARQVRRIIDPVTGGDLGVIRKVRKRGAQIDDEGPDGRRGSLRPDRGARQDRDRERDEAKTETGVDG